MANRKIAEIMDKLYTRPKPEGWPPKPPCQCPGLVPLSREKQKHLQQYVEDNPYLSGPGYASRFGLSRRPDGFPGGENWDWWSEELSPKGPFQGHHIFQKDQTKPMTLVRNERWINPNVEQNMSQNLPFRKLNVKYQLKSTVQKISLVKYRTCSEKSWSKITGE